MLPAAAWALLDRLTHQVQIIEANGESYRLKQAKKRTSDTKLRSKYGEYRAPEEVAPATVSKAAVDKYRYGSGPPAPFETPVATRQVPQGRGLLVSF